MAAAINQDTVTTAPQSGFPECVAELKMTDVKRIY